MITAKPTLEIVMHIELIDYLRFKIFILCSAFNIRSMLNYFLEIAIVPLGSGGSQGFNSLEVW